MRLLIATNNPGKRVELGALLEGIELVVPAELGLGLEVAEDGQSFAENARLKARAFARASGLVSLADDSGLEVDALGKAPGVRSARYGGPHLDDQGRCRLLLEQLRAFPAPGDRAARFRCWVAVCGPDGRRCEAEGICDGHISLAPAGAEGFGYDPVFYLPEYRRTMAQLGPELKNQLSHRARAIRAIHPLLLQTFPELRA